ncbi:hypothetical protein K505DRAFT_395390 [Melanomma pulvis-pyrius CBS 109.77]|uniref:Uncharacterized protein n=1 Tax=Melanomma pulvis-pyrius CBS 109.77 TaxID=1314802 RepID=A0A6A6XNX9_9PLEO|nr:hypothetical protein K505DRAFT_395390 [Melanomma pulvis-pyrius CBS 109.77]
MDLSPPPTTARRVFPTGQTGRFMTTQQVGSVTLCLDLNVKCIDESTENLEKQHVTTMFAGLRSLRRSTSTAYPGRSAVTVIVGIPRPTPGMRKDPLGHPARGQFPLCSESGDEPQGIPSDFNAVKRIRRETPDEWMTSASFPPPVQSLMHPMGRSPIFESKYYIAFPNKQRRSGHVPKRSRDCIRTSNFAYFRYSQRCTASNNKQRSSSPQHPEGPRHVNTPYDTDPMRQG